MKKFIARLIILFILTFTLVPVFSIQPVSAYTASLLDGKPMNGGYDAFHTSSTTLLLTNNLITGINISPLSTNTTNIDTYWYLFSGPTTITSYMSAGNQNVKIDFMDAAGTVIYSNTPSFVAFPGQTINLSTPITGVYRVSITNTNSAFNGGMSQNEFDVFGPTTRPTYSGSLLDGKPMNGGYDAFHTSSTTLLLTNNLITGINISPLSTNTTNIDTYWYLFTAPTTITSYMSAGNQNVKIDFMDAAGTVIYSNTPSFVAFPGQTINLSTPITGVYRVSITNTNAAFNGGMSQNEFDVFGPPTPPNNLIALAGNSQVTLLWSEVSNASSFSIKRSINSNGTFELLATNLYDPNFIDTTAVAGNTYYYIVTALNGGGESSISNVASTTLKPNEPMDLTTFSGNNQVGLSWTKSTGAISYSINRSSTNGGPYTQIANNILTTSYNDTSLTNGSTYYYVVIANNTGGDSNNSNQAIGNPQIPAPVAPINLTASAEDAQVLLNWNSVVTAASYNVKRSSTNNGTFYTIANVSSTSYLDSLVTNGGSYYYRVSAINAGGESDNSAYASATPQILVPGAPENLIATSNDQEVPLSWNAATGATGYNIKRSLTAGGPYNSIVSVTGTTYNDVNVINGIAYYYVVTATNPGGESGISNETSAIPQVLAPKTPIDLVASVGDVQVGLNWSSVIAADSYTIKRSLLAGGPYTTIISNVTASTYNDDTVTNGVTYFYVVSATNAGGESNNSNEVSATPQSSTNIASASTVTSSSEFNSSNYKKTNVVDGIIGHATNGQWASLGELTPWITLTWDNSKTINNIKLYDRPNTNNIYAGVLTFSDGSSIVVDELDNAGAVKDISFSSKTITWVKFEVTSGSGVNVGLSEFQVYGF